MLNVEKLCKSAMQGCQKVCGKICGKESAKWWKSGFSTFWRGFIHEEVLECGKISQSFYTRNNRLESGVLHSFHIAYYNY